MQIRHFSQTSKWKTFQDKYKKRLYRRQDVTVHIFLLVYVLTSSISKMMRHLEFENVTYCLIFCLVVHLLLTSLWYLCSCLSIQDNFPTFITEGFLQSFYVIVRTSRAVTRSFFETNCSLMTTITCILSFKDSLSALCFLASPALLYLHHI